MIEHYYNKTKVLGHYATFIVIAMVAFGGLAFQIRDLNHVYIYGPFVLYGLYLAASYFRRVLYQKPVFVIKADRLIVERINAMFYHSPVEIMFDEIKYITTDISKGGGKVFFVKTKDESEYAYSLAMLDATQEDIIEELKKYDKTLFFAGEFEIEEDNSLNMD